MNQITFRGAVLKNAEICRPKKGGVYVRAHFASEITEPVIEAMAWGEVPECVEGAKLSGAITSPQKFILTPNDKELRDYEIELECSEVTDFSIQRIEKKKTGAVRVELRFVARSNQHGAEGHLAEWMRMIGGAEAALKVTYESGSAQTSIPMDEPEGEEADAEQAPAEAVLAPAAVMGGTHQGRRGKRDRKAEAVADGSADTDCVDCNNSVPFMAGDPSMHQSGQPCRAVVVQ